MKKSEQIEFLGTLHKSLALALVDALFLSRDEEVTKSQIAKSIHAIAQYQAIVMVDYTQCEYKYTAKVIEDGPIGLLEIMEFIEAWEEEKKASEPQSTVKEVEKMSVHMSELSPELQNKFMSLLKEVGVKL